MVSDIQHFLNWIHGATGISNPANILLVCALFFTAVIAYIVYVKTTNVYSSLASAFFVITFCTVLLITPVTIYFVISAIFALIVMGKFVGAF